MVNRTFPALIGISRQYFPQRPLSDKGPSTLSTLAYHLAIHDYQTDIIVRLMIDPLSNVENLYPTKNSVTPTQLTQKYKLHSNQFKV